MNQRINNLIEQCTVQNFSDCIGGYETFDHEKFAELIVRECASIAQTYMSRWPEDHELTKQIKEHFGVEES
jgi:hypothetical protein